MCGEIFCVEYLWNYTFEDMRERERERLSLSAFLRTEDIGVHIVHISRLIITYTLEQIIFPHIDNPQSTGCN